MWTTEAFDAAVRRHDAGLAARGQTIWVGSEPTFTDRMSQSPPWLNRALGGDKEERAQALLGALCQRFKGGLVLRSMGRQYPGEDAARWNLGLYRCRSGAALWDGPPDPILTAAGTSTGLAPDLTLWAAEVGKAFAAVGFAAVPVLAQDPLERRLLLGARADVVFPDAADPRLQRVSVHAQLIPASGLVDELAQAGLLLFAMRMAPFGGQATACVELPQLQDVPLFLTVLDGLQQAARACALPALIVAGYPPPVDAMMEFTTVTPDPAVIEINTAPSVDATDFLWRSREIYAAAAEQGLAPYRLYFNGTVADSGGGGQITLGGPSPLASPFLKEPRLLPRLVRFVNRHPALSYLYSHDFVGSSGQSVRADERGSDAFDELTLALALLAHDEAPTHERLWHSLAPFLCDAAGNSHLAEMNIEKLWNPFLAGRGMLGLVEFRALRMQQTPERATALVCLLRSVVAMLAGADDGLPLIDWGRELHQRFALPFYLERDLDAVLKVLDAAGLGLDESIHAVLLRESFRLWGQAVLPGCALEIRRGLEFWPLLGDASSPEQGGSFRMVDASTARIELRLRPQPGGSSAWRDWQLHAAGVQLLMRHEVDEAGELQVFGMRYRSFVPAWGLHPALAAPTPVTLLLRHPDHATDYRLTLHEWQPDGGAYAGLPADLAEASQRRAERVALAVVPRDAGFCARAAPERGLGPYCLDLRWL